MKNFINIFILVLLFAFIATNQSDALIKKYYGIQTVVEDEQGNFISIDCGPELVVICYVTNEDPYDFIYFDVFVPNNPEEPLANGTGYTKVEYEEISEYPNHNARITFSEQTETYSTYNDWLNAIEVVNQ